MYSLVGGFFPNSAQITEFGVWAMNGIQFWDCGFSNSAETGEIVVKFCLNKGG